MIKQIGLIKATKLLFYRGSELKNINLIKFCKLN